MMRERFHYLAVVEQLRSNAFSSVIPDLSEQLYHFGKLIGQSNIAESLVRIYTFSRIDLF